MLSGIFSALPRQNQSHDGRAGPIPTSKPLDSPQSHIKEQSIIALHMQGARTLLVKLL